ncbi:hypothetical protein FZ029_31430 [Azospirillum sp. Sh1]|nr:hypothetical protein FZ029_31430 [Azospirillum sp. Sh1]
MSGEDVVGSSKKAVYRAQREDRASATPKAGRTFWSGFVMGLGAMTLLGPTEFNPPRYSGDGIRGSWRAVGDHLRTAMRRERDGQAF